MSARPAPALPVEQWPSCDRCSAASLYRVMTGVGPLFLCGHHFTKNRSAIDAAQCNVEARYPIN